MGFFDDLFGGKDPSKEANKYLSQIPGRLGEYYNPYIQAGRGALGDWQSQLGGLIKDPGGRLNEIGGGYKESPGFQHALQQALGGAGRAAAAGGMAGSPMHEQQNMGLASDIASQDYNNWMQQALGLYGGGLQGMGNIAGMGLQASGGMADQIAQMLAQQGHNAYEGAKGRNAAMGGLFGSLLGGGLGFMTGGPGGALLGSGLLGGGGGGSGGLGGAFSKGGIFNK
jgi:hypothetical protein